MTTCWSWCGRNYSDFGPTLASEALLERHSVDVSRETLRKWMTEAGLWLSRKQRRTFISPDFVARATAKLIQIAAASTAGSKTATSPARCWSSSTMQPAGTCSCASFGARARLLTSKALQGYLQSHGCPVAFYSDKHSVFRVTKTEALGGSGMTQFGRALSELNIEILCANSSQAKGRVERANRTLQDRLVKELRLSQISTVEAGNNFLSGFMESG